MNIFLGFNRVDVKSEKIFKTCNNNYFERLKKTLEKEENSIIIFGGRFALYLSNYYFNNQEGGIDEIYLSPSKYISLGMYNSIEDSFKDTLFKLSNKNKIILIYPIPEVGLDPNKKIFNQWVKQRFNKNFNMQKITTSYDIFKERNKSSFELLDSIKGDNIFRIYPHRLVCNSFIKDRCITHDDNNIFYVDSNHPSLKFAEMINDLIMKKIVEIEVKSK